MSDPTPVPLPPIPDGCGILPIPENPIHRGPHPEMIVDAREAQSVAPTGDDPMESHYRRVLARALALCAGALLLTSLVATSLIPGSGQESNLAVGHAMARAIFLTQLMFVAFCGRFVPKLGMAAAGVLLFGYAVFCGLEFSALLPPAALATAFLCAGLMYAGTALWGFRRRVDLASPITPIFMILGGGAALVPVNLALGTSKYTWSLSSIAVVVFAGLAAWHGQQIRDLYQDFDDDNSEGWKASLVGALLLLLNSVNLYLLVAGILVQIASFVSDDDAKEAMRDDLPN